MKLTTLIPLFIILLSLQAAAQTITTKPLKETAYCPGTAIEVSYEATGTFQSSNIFKLQISGSDGTFNNFRYLGNINGTTSGTFNITLPEDISIGTKFRFRVISSLPYVAGSDNGSNIEIFPHLNNFGFNHDRYYYKLGEPVKLYFSSDSIKYYNKYLQFVNSDFGEDASPRYFNGFNPPLINFSKTGIKKFIYEVKYQNNCSYFYHGENNNAISILDCNLKIDSNTLVINSDTTIGSPYKYNQVWIMPNHKLIVDDIFVDLNFAFILENAATLEFRDGPRNAVIYMKSGSIMINGDFGGYNAYLQMPETSNNINPRDTLTNRNLVIKCDSLGIDYTNAPALGKKILGISGVKDAQAISDFKITPNPANEQINIEYNLFTPGNVRISIINQLGLETALVDEFVPAGNQLFKQPIENKLPNGVYFIKLQAGSDVKYKKVVISR